MIYRHYKGGLYKVINENVIHTETSEQMVYYQCLTTGAFYVRPHEMFFGLVVVPYSGKTVRRFVVTLVE